jgi:RHS repeat-associated protein
MRPLYHELRNTARSVTTPDGNTTTYAYDSEGELSTITPPGPMGQTKLTYDGDGNVAAETDGNGHTTTYTWDAMNQLTKVAFSDGRAISYTYDADGYLTGRSGGSGPETFTYDNLERLTASTDAGAATSYGYDAIGNLTSLTAPAGNTTYGYNNVNEPTSVKDPWRGTTTFSYKSADDTELASIAYPNSVTESFSYDKSKRISSLTASNTGGSTLLSQSFSYTDPSTGSDSSLRWSMTNGSGTTNYSYDALNRLTSAQGPSSSYSYGYDGDGNITSKTANGTTTNYTYNDDDQLTSQGASYDNAGNLTGGAGFSSFGYDAANHTTQITPSGGSQQQLTYAGASQNLLRSAGTTTLSYNSLGIASTITGSSTANYLRDPSGSLLGENVNGNTYYYILDAQKSVTDLADNTGNAADSYAYSPYGETTNSTGSVPNPFGYDSGMQIPGTSLIHFGARYYNPSTGNWTQPDPVAHARDLTQVDAYGYAGDDPINATDRGRPLFCVGGG